MFARTGTGSLRDAFRWSGPRLLGAGLLGLVLSACAQPDTQLVRSASVGAVAPQEAIALPPPGGPSIVGISERRYANAVQQEIALATNSSVPGQNYLRVELFGSMGGEAGQTRLADRTLHEGEVLREMRAALPSVAMQRSPLYAQNAYGPFGYALGSAGRNDRCIYAWQRIAGTRDAAPFANLGTVQLRFRMCQAGASERGLLAMMFGYTINTSFGGSSWNPFGSPASPDPRLGVSGQSVVPSGEEGFATMLDPPPVPRQPSARPAAPPTAASAPTSISRSPLVPRPPGEGRPPESAPQVPPPPAQSAPPGPIVPRPPQQP